MTSHPIKSSLEYEFWSLSCLDNHILLFIKRPNFRTSVSTKYMLTIQALETDIAGIARYTQITKNNIFGWI